jgi:uncharacterized membrane protein
VFQHGTKGYALSQTNGNLLLRFGRVSLVDHVSTNATVWLFLSEATWDSNDHVNVYAVTDASTFTLFDKTGTQIEAQHVPKGVWVKYTRQITGNWVDLFVDFVSTAADELALLDNVRVTGVYTGFRCACPAGFTGTQCNVAL